jgi:pimeloyl-ACP methyl ester carboxylesterase
MGSFAVAQKVQLKDGRILQGKMMVLPGVAKNPIASRPDDEQNQSMPILMVHDELRRTYVPKFFLDNVIDEGIETQIRIKLWQNVSNSGGAISSVGPSLGITPFDEFGRRIYRMQTRDGPLAVVQGITEIAPRYVKVEGLRGQPRSPVWDMRLATSSIPRETLARILARAVSHDDPQNWLKVVRFYLQAERYREASLELEAVIRQFPEMEGLEPIARDLKQMGARRILQEIELRSAAGQHELVRRLLDNFPPEEVAGETLQQVREMTADYAGRTARLQSVKGLLQAVAEQVSDEDHRTLVQPLVQEIIANLTHNNLKRLMPFIQLADDASLSADEKVALATSGWVLGADGAKQKISVAISLLQVRDMVRKYLREPLAHERLTLLESIRSAEGADVPSLARLIAHMTPPWEIPEKSVREYGAYELTAPGQSENGDFRYLVQLPPEYDASRRYPTIVALNGAYNSPRQELEFWTGSPPRSEAGEMTGARRGQAMRHGYITIAIDWQKKQQYEYEYTLREHEAVLTCLRDATRRFHIDNDRVYLTGHGMGGDAAWDLAVAHPDVWAGVLPFVAQFSQVKKYVQHYWENARYVPLYFVAGEKDGSRMSGNAAVLDKFFLKRFDTTVVEYLGRGHEPFSDEVLEAFSWMELPTHRRRGSPPEFTCNTMRPWDNFFWWIEGRNFPNSVHPANWPLRNARPTQVYGRVQKANHLLAKTAAEQTTLWLSPDLVDFSKPIEITLNGRKLGIASGSTRPDPEVLLEDVRTRGDRHRPFWAKLQIP